ncbi:LexA family protein [Clostridium beijerinckii]|jgi:SOS-response transcriptional repressors (RecA-mediated autopeptidases)|uniref:LexA family protein n=1 Tax=Clostridium beijerinckii TaxID=1520 RepID=UPI001360EA06|nr:transcriptional regulator [Clostridium beijerinckii]MZK51887.1 transcriptional regulator [Clostridium beijerinckii]MZK58504.1 transcriptional regulator [Clostridium beijerinckii]MZK68852.1 transcriptional regulator [Clostridium beijerinckii]MZK74223.1 transcriptional regulator [Clostridium beijerinckii]MZK83924.1 transcriptional regulator [Clostridium beijerinckii]
MLTEKQKEILYIIKNYIDKEKISPSIREIGQLAGLKSTSTVHSYLNRLESKGYIYRSENRARSLRVKEAEGI